MKNELHALVLGLYYTFVIAYILSTLLSKKFYITALVHSKTLFDVVAKQMKITEKRLQVYICAF